MPQRLVTCVLALCAIVATACQPAAVPPAGQPATPAATTPPAAKPTTAPAVAPTAQATSKPEAAAPGTAAGGQVRLTLNQEPDTLNPFYSGLRATFTVTQAIFNGLVVVNEQGNYEGDLAAEVPTVQNGGVSADGLTITYKLRQGVTWADGQPFTAEDVKFTYDAIMNPANTISGKSVYGKIDSLTVKDPLTVELKMKEPYAAYAEFFSYPVGILPRHALGSLPDLNKADFNRKPFGTGPYRVTDWQAANYIQLEANPNYYKGAPKIGRVIVRIVPDKNTQLAQVRANETDVAVDLNEADAVEVEKISGWKAFAIAGLTSDRMFLNLAEPGVADGSRPHPVLGDKRVRQALEMSINKQQLVDRVLFGKTQVATSEYPVGWPAPNLQPSRFDVEGAKKLLDEAGWQPGADGIRENGGRKLHLSISSTSGNTLRENVEQLVQAGWKSVGVDLEIKNATAAVLVGEWSENGLVQRGNFDIAYYGFTPGIDPSGTISPRFHSKQIPQESNQGEGDNGMRYRDPQVDQWIEEADRTLDQARRKELYGQVMRKIAEDVPVIYLYNRANVEAVSQRLQGPRSHPFRWLTWNIHEWTISG
jgi:peptide/nickel transport system substrate-binding protein